MAVSIDKKYRFVSPGVFIDEVEYLFEDMTTEQQTLVNHVADLDRKIGSARFNLDQLAVGRDAFMQMLKKSLEAQEVVQ